MLTMVWKAFLIGLLVFVVALLALLMTRSLVQPYYQQNNQATYNRAEQTTNQDESWEALWQRTKRDPVAFFTFVLAISTTLLFIIALGQLWFLSAANETGEKAAKAAQQSVEIAERALIASQRAFIRVVNFPWLWRPDNDRPGKYFYDITPLIENAGNTPTVGMRLIINSALRDTPLPEDFDFGYGDVAPEPSLVGGRQTIGAYRAFILDEDLLSVQIRQIFLHLGYNYLSRCV